MTHMSNFTRLWVKTIRGHVITRKYILQSMDQTYEELYIIYEAAIIIILLNYEDFCRQCSVVCSNSKQVLCCCKH